MSRKEIKAANNFHKLENFWKISMTGTETKILIFNTGIMSFILYGGELGKSTTEIHKKINSFQSKCRLKKIFRVHCKEFLATSEILSTANQPKASDMVR